MNEYTNSEIGHAENKTVLSSLGINGMQLVIQFVNLTIVLLVVWYLILKPLTKKMDERKKANLFKDEMVFGVMEELRKHCDQMEEKVADDLWPLPKYREMLFLK